MIDHTALLPNLEGETDEKLIRLLDFLLEMDGLKDVERQVPLTGGHRHERTAEHCWYVALAAIAMHRYASEDVDLGRAVILAVLHDLPEVRAGDTFAYGPGERNRRPREIAAMRALLSELPEAEAGDLDSAWWDFEHGASPEARYVYALDSLLPMFMNLAGGPQSSWVTHNVNAKKVLARIEKVRAAVPQLAALAHQAVSEGIRRGHLK